MGGFNPFIYFIVHCTILAIFKSTPIIGNNSHKNQPNLKNKKTIIIYIKFSFICHQAHFLSSYCLEMTSDWKSLPQIQKGQKIHVQNQMISSGLWKMGSWTIMQYHQRDDMPKTVWNSWKNSPDLNPKENLWIQKKVMPNSKGATSVASWKKIAWQVGNSITSS